MQAMVVGHDHAFGKDREGGLALLDSLGQKHGFVVDVVPPLTVADQVVSSSKIRHALADQGQVADAAGWLGRAYSLSGRVVRGAQRGRTLGFPTANLQPSDSRKLVPAVGVYAVWSVLPDGSRVQSMMNIGRRPTFEGTEIHLEIHLLDFDGDLYDQRLSVEFVERLRPERRFGSVEALVAQLREDRERCKSLFSGLN
jgi:riboflavin kinase/FMN adenylyltransferase